MLLLTSTTDILTMITGSAGSIVYKVDYVDYNGTTIAPARTPNAAAVATATTTTICTSPAASTQRNVTRIIINNTHASVANLVTINHSDGTTVMALHDSTLAAGESMCMDEEGEWHYYDSNGTPKVTQNSISGPVTATTLTASGAVTLSPASANVAISPTGTGTVTISPAGTLTLGTAAVATTLLGNLSATGSNQTVTLSPTGTGTVAISPVGALTINPTAASTINNASIGATTRSTGAFSLIGAGGASAAAAYITAAAGTATVASATLTAGTILTTAAAGAVETDTTALYMTTDTTNGRAMVDRLQYFRLAANGTAISTIADMFGTNDGISTVLNGVYEIEWGCYGTVATGGTMTFTIVSTQIVTNMVAYYDGSNIAGIGTAGAPQSAGAIALTAASNALPATGSLAAANHFFKVTAIVEAATAGNIRLRGTMSAGTWTPLRDSYIKVRRLPAGNVGTYVA